MDIYTCKAKRISDGKWVYGYVGRMDYMINKLFLFGVEFVIHEIDPNTICRNTGLKDKNGKPIFENDLLHYYNEFSEKWSDMCTVKYGEFNCSCCDGVYGWYFEDGDIRNVNMYEVCGNKFDNTNLMEG